MLRSPTTSVASSICATSCTGDSVHGSTRPSRAQQLAGDAHRLQEVALELGERGDEQVAHRVARQAPARRRSGTGTPRSELAPLPPASATRQLRMSPGGSTPRERRSRPELPPSSLMATTAVMSRPGSPSFGSARRARPREHHGQPRPAAHGDDPRRPRPAAHAAARCGRLLARLACVLSHASSRGDCDSSMTLPHRHRPDPLRRAPRRRHHPSLGRPVYRDYRAPRASSTCRTVWKMMPMSRNSEPFFT